MAKILNSVLISVVAFFGFLAAFTLIGMRDAEGDSSAPHATISKVHVDWGEATSRGTDVEVTLTLHNPGPHARATSVAYSVVVDGVTFDAATVETDTELRNRRDGTIRFTAHLGPDFAASWWRAHASNGEDSGLAITGTVDVEEDSGIRSLPFEWTSTWEGDMAQLFSALVDCPQEESAACIASTSAHWQGDALAVTVTVRNQREEDFHVASGVMDLTLGGIYVAAAAVEATEVPAYEEADVTMTLYFDDGRMADWWAGHVNRCEASQAHLDLRLELRDRYDWDFGTATWQTPSAGFTTAFICNGVA